MVRLHRLNSCFGSPTASLASPHLRRTAYHPGPGNRPPILAHSYRQGIDDFPHASRVS